MPRTTLTFGGLLIAGRVVHAYMPQLVGEGLHAGRVVHVGPDGDDVAPVVGHPVCAHDRRRSTGVRKGEALCRHLAGKPRPESRRRLPFQQPRHWPFRDLRS